MTQKNFVYFYHSFSRLVDQYIEISDKALSTPENTEKLMEQMAYISKCESETIFLLEKLLIKSKDRLAFLSDHANFSPAETKLNADVSSFRIFALLEEHCII